MHSFIKNHPLIDGNKRTAIATASIFLLCNNYSLKTSNKVLDCIGIFIFLCLSACPAQADGFLGGMIKTAPTDPTIGIACMDLSLLSILLYTIRPKGAK